MIAILKLCILDLLCYLIGMKPKNFIVIDVFSPNCFLKAKHSTVALKGSMHTTPLKF